MNRRALLKGLGASVGALALLPLVPLLPKAPPPVTGGIPMSNGLHHFTFCQGRLFWLDYASPQMIFGSKRDDITRWGEEVGEIIEEEVSKISRIPL